MTTDFPPVVSSDTVEHCRNLCQIKSALPACIEWKMRCQGIISINDVVKETILTQQETISHLQDYIHS